MTAMFFGRHCDLKFEVSCKGYDSYYPRHRLHKCKHKDNKMGLCNKKRCPVMKAAKGLDAESVWYGRVPGTNTDTPGSTTCPKCRGEGTQPHTCPYEEEINGRSELCSCCALCQVDCELEI